MSCICQIKYYGKIEEGKVWRDIRNECDKQKIELIATDAAEIEQHVKEVGDIEELLEKEKISLKNDENTAVTNELKDLASSLNAMKLRQLRESTGKVEKKRVTSIKSKIKLTKDERDAMVANSLQLDATIKKILNN